MAWFKADDQLPFHPKVLAAARVILDRPGGRGAVREVCDLIPIPAEAAEPLPNPTLTSLRSPTGHPSTLAGHQSEHLAGHQSAAMSGHASAFPDDQPSVPRHQPQFTHRAEISRANRKQVS